MFGMSTERLPWKTGLGSVLSQSCREPRTTLLRDETYSVSSCRGSGVSLASYGDSRYSLDVASGSPFRGYRYHG